uniref:phage terminase large subunit family protein n=1 Tax=Ornithobacterium rhinotracheale TaxID=28251 RepID=UPI0039A70E79
MKRQNKIAIERYLQKLALARSAGAPNPYETAQEKAQRLELFKKNPAEMVAYYFPHYATCDCADFQVQWAKIVQKDKTFKGIAQWGRASAKSVWNNIFIPFWLWLRGEDMYFVVIGNNKLRAEQLLEDLRAEFEANPRIISDFGEQVQQGTWESGFFITKSGFIGQALSMGQSVRGLRVKNLRPTHIVVDDIETKDFVKNPKRQLEMVEWILRDLIPTMDGKQRRFVQANNRFAPVMIQTLLAERNPDWKVHEVNAYNPVTYEPTWHQKYDGSYFKDIEREIGTLAANAEFNNSPHIEGAIFKDEQFQWCKLPRIDHFEAIIGHWDIAYAGTPNSDYNAVVIAGLKDKKFYVIDTFCLQSKMKQAALWICDYQKQLPSSAVVHWQYEAQFWNDEVARILEETQSEKKIQLNITKKQLPKVSKLDRILRMQPYFQNARVYFNENLKPNKHFQVGLAQLKGIEPSYKVHDDFPDALEVCISELEKFTPTRKSKFLMGKYKRLNEW